MSYKTAFIKSWNELVSSFKPQQLCENISLLFRSKPADTLTLRPKFLRNSNSLKEALNPMVQAKTNSLPTKTLESPPSSSILGQLHRDNGRPTIVRANPPKSPISKFSYYNNPL